MKVVDAPGDRVEHVACPDCGRKHAVTRDGRIWTHHVPDLKAS